VVALHLEYLFPGGAVGGLDQGGTGLGSLEVGLEDTASSDFFQRLLEYLCADWLLL